MPSYPESDRQQILREYFRGADDAPLCPACGEDLEIRLDLDSEHPLLDVSCPGCRRRFRWAQEQDEQPWRPLYLAYFVERLRKGRPLRCPIDDSRVVTVDFGDGVVEFRCPFCNRRGRTPKRGTKPAQPS